MAKPDWLPDVAPLTGPVDQVVRQLYALFHRDVVRGALEFRHVQVWWDRRPREVFGLTYEEAFWHLVSREDEVTGHRELDPPRAERLPWCAPTVRNCKDRAVRTWDYVRPDGRTSTYIWLSDLDYVVVMRRRPHRSGDVYFLVTAYHIDGPGARRWFESSYARRQP